MILLIGDNNVDVVLRAEAVVSNRKQAVRVWRKVDADDFGRFICNDIEEAWILVGEAVVVLSCSLALVEYHRSIRIE